MSTKNAQKIDVEQFVEKYNKNVPKMPFDFLFVQEFLKELFYLLKVSNRSHVWLIMFENFFRLVEESTNPFEFTNKCSKLKITDIFSDEEIKTFFFLSIPQNVNMPIDEAETEEA